MRYLKSVVILNGFLEYEARFESHHEKAVELKLSVRKGPGAVSYSAEPKKTCFMRCINH